ncbi:MAG TPA: hypothetical protein ENN66_06260 [Proteobacteria bacterium]|nr:hypothetical protein [Pseudomonadota bacterium]
MRLILVAIIQPFPRAELIRIRPWEKLFSQKAKTRVTLQHRGFELVTGRKNQGNRLEDQFICLIFQNSMPLSRQTWPPGLRNLPALPAFAKPKKQLKKD